MAFKPGDKNINRSGRPPGTPDRRSQLRELIKPHVPELIDKALQLARGGDSGAIRLLLDKVIPALKPVSEPVELDISGGNATAQATAIFQAAIAGEISLDEANGMTTMLLSQARIAEIDGNNSNIKAMLAKINALGNDMTALERARIDEETTRRIKRK